MEKQSQSISMHFDKRNLDVSENSTIVEGVRQVKNSNHIYLLDFARTSKDINNLFEDLYSLDFFFLQLQQLTGVRLYEQESVIIFDEVQLLPKARQAGNAMHRSLMRIFRLYMLVGGMPQAVENVCGR